MNHLTYQNLLRLHRYGALTKQWYPLFYRYALSITRCHEAADNAACKALLRLYRYQKDVTGPQAIRTFLKHHTCGACIYWLYQQAQYSVAGRRPLPKHAYPKSATL